MRSGLLQIALVVSLISCKKKEDFPLGPVIAFQSISASEVVQFDNQVVIKLSFKDHNGDIGEPNPDIYSLKVKDARLSAPDWYHVPPMTPELEELQIEGSLSVQLGALFLLGSGDQEVTSFVIQLQDRAGNWSNEAVTPEVVVKKNP